MLLWERYSQTEHPNTKRMTLSDVIVMLGVNMSLVCSAFVVALIFGMLANNQAERAVEIINHTKVLFLYIYLLIVLSASFVWNWSVG